MADVAQTQLFLPQTPKQRHAFRFLGSGVIYIYICIYTCVSIEAEAPRDVCARIQAWIYLPVFTHVFIYGRKHTHREVCN